VTLAHRYLIDRWYHSPCPSVRNLILNHPLNRERLTAVDANKLFGGLPMSATPSGGSRGFSGTEG